MRRRSVLDIAITSDGAWVPAIHITGHFKLTGTTVENGRLHTGNLAVIDVASGRLSADICFDDFPAGAGSNELSIIRFP